MVRSLIPDAVPKCVVQILEAVDIEKEDRDPVSALRPGKGSREAR